jgi:hypothetical protein
MLTVIETPTFRRLAEEIWGEEERMDFVTWIAANSDAGDAIKGSAVCGRCVGHAQAWASVAVPE